MSWRDLMCGEPRSADVGRTVTMAGWAARRRDHGGLVFVDLRDHTGLMQLVVNPERSPAAAERAREIRNEFVLQARGEVVARSADTVSVASFANPLMPCCGVTSPSTISATFLNAAMARTSPSSGPSPASLARHVSTAPPGARPIGTCPMSA